MNQTYAYSRYDRKIKFRMVSPQHFINEAPGEPLEFPYPVYLSLVGLEKANNCIHSLFLGGTTGVWGTGVADQCSLIPIQPV